MDAVHIDKEAMTPGAPAPSDNNKSLTEWTDLTYLYVQSWNSVTCMPINSDSKLPICSVMKFCNLYAN